MRLVGVVVDGSGGDGGVVGGWVEALARCFFFVLGVIGGVGEKLVGWVAEDVGRGSR